ncbi:MAG: hypothetical protein DRO67_01230 [Candidatus Asgardarchaeum californiense]|nr:MAG: hypothetical protein DRO67_01230 [Candidatus Asgardarchaeum californiense]
MKKFIWSGIIVLFVLLYGPYLACSEKTKPDAPLPPQIDKKPNTPKNITYRVIGKKKPSKEDSNE